MVKKLMFVAALIGVLVAGAVAGEVVGQVVDARGTGIAGAVVQINVMTNAGVRTVQARTSERGLFSFDLAQYEGRALLSVRSRGVGSTRTALFVEARGETRVQIVLGERERQQRQRQRRGLR